jgi:hypothetical protein
MIGAESGRRNGEPMIGIPLAVGTQVIAVEPGWQ